MNQAIVPRGMTQPRSCCDSNQAGLTRQPARSRGLARTFNYASLWYLCCCCYIVQSTWHENDSLQKNLHTQVLRSHRLLLLLLRGTAGANDVFVPKLRCCIKKFKRSFLLAEKLGPSHQSHLFEPADIAECCGQARLVHQVCVVSLHFQTRIAHEELQLGPVLNYGGDDGGLLLQHTSMRSYRRGSVHLGDRNATAALR